MNIVDKFVDELRADLRKLPKDFEDLHLAYCENVCLRAIERGEIHDHTPRCKSLVQKYGLHFAPKPGRVEA